MSNFFKNKKILIFVFVLIFVLGNIIPIKIFAQTTAPTLNIDSISPANPKANEVVTVKVDLTAEYTAKTVTLYVFYIDKQKSQNPPTQNCSFKERSTCSLTFQFTAAGDGQYSIKATAPDVLETPFQYITVGNFSPPSGNVAISSLNPTSVEAGEKFSIIGKNLCLKPGGNYPPTVFLKKDGKSETASAEIIGTDCTTIEATFPKDTTFSVGDVVSVFVQNFAKETSNSVNLSLKTPTAGGATSPNPGGTIGENGFQWQLKLQTAWPPSPMGTSLGESSTVTTLVKYFYDWAIALGGLAAFISLVIAGLQYLTSAGNPAGTKAAMDRIKSAALGLLLLLGSFLILNFINPELTSFPKNIFSAIDTSSLPAIPAPEQPGEKPQTCSIKFWSNFGFKGESNTFSAPTGERCLSVSSDPGASADIRFLPKSSQGVLDGNQTDDCNMLIITFFEKQNCDGVGQPGSGMTISNFPSFYFNNLKSIKLAPAFSKQ